MKIEDGECVSQVIIWNIFMGNGFLKIRNMREQKHSKTLKWAREAITQKRIEYNKCLDRLITF